MQRALRAAPHRRYSFLLLLSVLLAACDAVQETPPMPPPQVGFVVVEPQAITLQQSLPGRTSAYLIAQVRPQVSGVIQKRQFQEGQRVEAGQVLYEIDARRYRARVATAQAELNRVKAAARSVSLRADRAKSLLASRSISQQEFDEAQAARDEALAAIASAQAVLDTASINLQDARIKAPIGGRISRSEVTAGALVTANQVAPLTTIRQLDPIYVDLTQSVQDLRKLRLAIERGELESVRSEQAKVTLLFDDGSEYHHQGTLQFSDFAVDEGTGSITLRALFPNPKGELLPGMFVRARLPEGHRQNAIVVPQKAISRDPTGQAFAWTLSDDNTARLTPVVTERALDNQWLIASGLQQGDRLIVDGFQMLRPDTPVTPQDVTPQAATNDAATDKERDSTSADNTPATTQQ